MLFVAMFVKRSKELIVLQCRRLSQCKTVAVKGGRYPESGEIPL